MNQTEFSLHSLLKKYMPVNQNALVRYLVLDKCFRNTGRKYFIDDLINECNNVLRELNQDSKGIKRRQIFLDMDFMKSEAGFSAPIEAYNDGRKKYYRYSDPNYSILGSLIPTYVIDLSKSLIDILKKFDGLASHFIILQHYDQLLKFYKPTASEEFSSFVEFDFNQDYTGLEHFGQLFMSIEYKKVLKINYQPFDKETPYEYIFHPHYLKEYNHRWYLIGYNETKNERPYVLALDRIKSIEELKDKEYVPSDINYKDYYYDIIGITRIKDMQPEKIVLKIHPDFKDYIITNPIHPSQKNKRHSEDNWLNIELNCIINNELLNTISRYGHFIKVIEPIHLKDKLIERYKQALELQSN